MKTMKNMIPAILVIVTICSLVLISKSSDAAKTRETVQRPDYIPVEVIEALKVSDVNGAVRVMRMEATNERSKYLLREMQRIDSENIKKISRHNHRELFNVGVAYHNLYLLLKGYGVENDDLFKKAMKYYKLAYKTQSPSRKNNIDITMAALLAAHGDKDKAEKLFSKTDLNNFPSLFRKYEGLALYYSANGDTANAIANIEAAYKTNPDYTKFWLGVSDDFNPIYNDEDFQGLLKKWEIRPISRGSSSPYTSKEKNVVY